MKKKGSVWVWWAGDGCCDHRVDATTSVKGEGERSSKVCEWICGGWVCDAGEKGKKWEGEKWMRRVGCYAWGGR